MLAHPLHPFTHTRLPRYCRGKRGGIIAVDGAHVLPDANAIGLGQATHLPFIGPNTIRLAVATVALVKSTTYAWARTWDKVHPCCPAKDARLKAEDPDIFGRIPIWCRVRCCRLGNAG
jgi:hypothetical protein